MIISRSSALMRLHGFAGRNLLQNRFMKSPESKRHEGGWYYRKLPPENQKSVYLYDCGAAVMWWWITWHMVTDYDELLPHYFPDPSKWTDEELGIPPI